jgi:outer membrane murein-binding lipoprotein Lpp
MSDELVYRKILDKLERLDAKLDTLGKDVEQLKQTKQTKQSRKSRGAKY